MPVVTKELEVKKKAIVPISGSQKLKKMIINPKGTINQMNMSIISEGREEGSIRSIEQ